MALRQLDTPDTLPCVASHPAWPQTLASFSIASYQYIIAGLQVHPAVSDPFLLLNPEQSVFLHGIISSSVVIAAALSIGVLFNAFTIQRGNAAERVGDPF
jgi:hypothetical protein